MHILVLPSLLSGNSIAHLHRPDLLQSVFNFMMLGLLTCINNEEEAEHIIRNVYEALKQGARLIVRDSLTKTDYREIFLYNFISGYQAVYRNVECYRELFVRCGFEIESEIALKEEVTDGIEYVNYGAILKKA